MKVFVIVFSLACFALVSTAQSVRWYGENSSIEQFKAVFNETENLNLNILSEKLKTSQKRLVENGYLLASVDSLKFDSIANYYTVHVSVGTQFRWAKLKSGNVDEGYLSKSGYRDRFFNDKPIDPAKVQMILDEILQQYENNGFPFAEIAMVNPKIEGNLLEADLQITKNRAVLVDTIVYQSEAKISESYLNRYLGFKNGLPYNEKKFQSIDKNINDIAFLQSSQPAQVIFSEGKARIDVFFKKRNASSFNGIIGFLPDEQTGEVTISGDAKLNLINTFGKGEILRLNWRRLKTNTQELTLETAIPYLFKTPLGVSGNFELYRRDSTFTTVTFRGGVQYLFSRGNFLEGYIENDQSNALSGGNLDLTENLPLNGSVEVLSYGMRYLGNFLDYRFNPTKGFSIESRFSVGNKTINPANPEEVNFLDSIALESELYKIRTDLSAYFPIIQRTTLKFRLQAGHLMNDQLFTNELFRLGGINTLRGFDEEIIFASSFAIPSVEFRYLLERNSYLAAFFDYAWYERKTLSESLSDQPFGFGAGLSFETNAGIFSLFYALGKQFDNPIEFRSGKIHFGFTSLF